jgi:hypothetical protein
MKPGNAAALGLLILGAAAPAPALELHGERGSPTDLAVAGRLAGVPDGGTRYISWPELRALPTASLTLDGEFIKGPQALTVVYLADLWKALPVGPGADTILATCTDGYAAVYTSAFIAQYRPFLVLEINGKGPGDWPPPGLAYNPGPYVVTVSAELVPAVARFPDVQHKKPWGVTKIEIAAYGDRFRGIYSGKWTSLSPAAKAGREIWVNACASCHSGPPATFGGTRSGRPFPVIAAYAGYDRAFFMRYVRDPKSLVPCAQMEPHPRYTDDELSGLIEFVTAGSERSP